tara:strand:+ start:258 stop:566 length:309 start_codon:yes stop_codon:yes gene_type:complete
LTCPGVYDSGCIVSLPAEDELGPGCTRRGESAIDGGAGIVEDHQFIIVILVPESVPDPLVEDGIEIDTTGVTEIRDLVKGWVEPRVAGVQLIGVAWLQAIGV